MPRQVRRPEPAEVGAAHKVIAAHLGPTPVIGGDEMVLKLESLQPTGSFKVRGALNALAHLGPDVQIVTASAGNHALGVGHAARLLGREATVVVAENASPAKLSALRRFPVRLIQTGHSYDDAEEYALNHADEGAYYLSGYNDPAVIAGQGTIGIELADQMDGPLTVVCGIGGGGLASGLALWAADRPDVRVVGVELAVSTAVSAATRAGHHVDVEVGRSIADGMAGGVEPGSVTIDIIRDHVSELVTVTEAEIRAALRHLAGSYGVVAEGAGAVPVAALLSDKVDVRGRAVAIVTGRNIALPVYAEILAGQG
jgi:threonine dehydratase